MYTYIKIYTELLFKIYYFSITYYNTKKTLIIEYKTN